MQAVFNAPSGATLIVSGGTCNEWVYLGNVSNISIGAWWGGRVTIPYLEIAGSRSVYLYGLDVKNGNAWTGIHIGQSQDVMLDTCTSTYSGGLGVNIDSASSVFMFGGQYSNNPGGGINLIQSSYLYLNSTSIDNNAVYGIWADQSEVWTDGGLEIANTTGGPYNGMGVSLASGSRGNFYTWAGNNNITGNQTAGFSVDQGARLVLMGGSVQAGYANNINGNGATGIALRAGSHATLGGGTHIANHSDVAIDVWGQSQVMMFADNVIQSNTGQAAIRIDGNSEGLIWNAAITGNSGPGVLAVNNSSAEVAGDALNGNTGGPFVCDATSHVITDLSPDMLGSSNSCKPSTGSGHHVHLVPPTSSGPRPNPVKAAEDRFRKLATKPK